MTLSLLQYSFGFKIPLFQPWTQNLSSGMHLLFGPNGVGKSTFFQSLLGYPPPLAGEAFWNGKKLHTLTPKQRAELLGYFPPHPTFGHYQTVREFMDSVLRFGRASKASVQNAMERWEVAPHLDAHPYLLSRGQQMSVHLARFFSSPRELYLMDEPTTGLDYVAQNRLRLECHERTKQGSTLLFIHHGPVIDTMGAASLLFMGNNTIRSVPSSETKALQQSAEEVFGVSFNMLGPYLVPTTEDVS